VAQSTLSPELGFLPHVSSLAARLTAAAAVFRRGGAARWCCEQGRKRLNCGGVAELVRTDAGVGAVAAQNCWNGVAVVMERCRGGCVA